MAAAARSSRLLLLSSRNGRGGGVLAVGCFPGLGSARHRQHQHRTYSGQDVFPTTMVRLTSIIPGQAGSIFSHVGDVIQGNPVHQRLPAWQNQQIVFCSTASPSDDVTVAYQNGLPVISLCLPSRRERCQFTLKPISDSVGIFLKQLQAEDKGIDRVNVYSTDGTRVASSTGIDVLLLDDFKLAINDVTYYVRPPKRELLSHEDATNLNDLKTLVQQLYCTLRIEEHQLNKERELIGRIEDLKQQLEPLEKVRLEVSRKAEKRTTWVLWGGLAYMATQFGILARLTWWEYSWDIMEPVTYFITYGSAIAMYAYFVLTRQEYIYPDARDRQHLLYFHKGAKKIHFNLEKYNHLKEAVAQMEKDGTILFKRMVEKVEAEKAKILTCKKSLEEENRNLLLQVQHLQEEQLRCKVNVNNGFQAEATCHH
uniref:Calcium uniporter protein n=1 Tax=Geotrypetes seraphini TaxID=260995 RepID=A0A6P8RB04_GEOSA|nr:calcium uniporter protein, mitochondrial isoform X3 [Geotrypetes seraphini]